MPELALQRGEMALYLTDSKMRPLAKANVLAEKACAASCVAASVAKWRQQCQFEISRAQPRRISQTGIGVKGVNRRPGNRSEALLPSPRLAVVLRVSHLGSVARKFVEFSDSFTFAQVLETRLAPEEANRNTCSFYDRCLLTSLVISNIETCFLPPKTPLSLSSALILRRFLLS